MTPTAPDHPATPTPADDAPSPWPALWALVIGFFMILVDSTIVSIATPALLEHFGTGLGPVLWVTSAYLLAYATPLLITGRLGDRFGQRRIFIAGIALYLGAGFAMTTPIPAIGSVLAEHLGWRTGFLVAPVVAVVAPHPDDETGSAVRPRPPCRDCGPPTRPPRPCRPAPGRFPAPARRSRRSRAQTCRSG